MKALALLLILASGLCAAENVLIVADEFPAMEVLAAKLKAGAGATSTIIKQDAIPEDLKPYSTMIVYIHKTITEPAEKRFIQYAEEGGRLILLHHSISSGKRPNKFWFPWLKIELPTGDFATGGYKYYEGITMDLVNLAPGHYVTSNKLNFKSVELHETEVYLNHILKGERTLLLGIKYTDAKSGVTYTQRTGGWLMKTGNGMVFYFMAGHSAKDFENPTYSQIIVNALTYKP
jgi:hypothetical protein